MLFGSSALIDDDLLKAYIFYGGLMVMKMLLLHLLTVRQRHSKKVFTNQEDINYLGGKVSRNDESVERVRRAHMNDMENVYLFFAAAAFYLTTRPEPRLALNLIRLFTASRFLHSFFYINETRQPARAIAYTVGFLIMSFMGFCTVKHYF